MARPCRLIFFFAFATLAATSAHAQTGDERYTIMRPEPGTSQPEPWLAPKYKSPRGTVQYPVIPPPARSPQPHVMTKPPLVVPQTGQVLQNLPTVAPSGPHRTETYQDRAVRCTHQAGVYGQTAGNPSAYVGTCINQ